MIPEYHIGQRVLLQARPYELPCPRCGYIPYSDGGRYTGEVSIIEISETAMCPKCDYTFSVSGFYTLNKIDGNGFMCVPYTLLEEIENEL